MDVGMGCRSADLHFIYLGLPIGVKMSMIDSWKEITKRFNKQHSS